MRLSSISLVVLLMCATGVRRAHAQYNVPSQASGDSRQILVIGDDPPPPTDSPPLKVGGELGASLDFLTSDPSLGGEELKFTDVVLFRVHGLVSIGKRLELFAGSDVLAKQPSYTNERIWNGALLGTRIRLTDQFSTYVRGQAGPNLGRDGYWVGGDAALQYKRDIAENTLFWESDLGGTYTQLLYKHPTNRPFWLAELMAKTGIAVRDKRGAVATWLTFSFHFPLVGRPELDRPDSRSGGALDPQTRVGVSMGILLGVTKTLDLFLEGSILDRGDLEDPMTTLPILNGGFDQTRLVFGFNRRFGDRRR
jgi:hypothetical protein